MHIAVALMKPPTYLPLGITPIITRHDKTHHRLGEKIPPKIFEKLDRRPIEELGITVPDPVALYASNVFAQRVQQIPDYDILPTMEGWQRLNDSGMFTITDIPTAQQTIEHAIARMEHLLENKLHPDVTKSLNIIRMNYAPWENVSAYAP